MHLVDDDKLNIDDVLKFAKERHMGQFRSDGSEYITHPIRVSEIVCKYKTSANANILKAGALLHDVLEDTYTSYKELVDRFGIVVASLVMEVTSSGFMPTLVGKRIYLAHKMRYMSSYALVIKLADRLDNISDLNDVPTEKIRRTFFDTIYMINYLETKRILTDAQRNLISAIRMQLENINRKYDFASKKLIQDTEIDTD